MKSRLLILGASLALIALAAGSLAILPFLLGTTTAAYFLLVLLDRYIKPASWRSITVFAIGGLMAAAFGVAEHLGIVGTLNGDTDSLIHQSALTLGLPFYMLVVIGTYADVLFSKIRMPSLVNFMLLIVYVPKFLSGPIERSGSFLEQINRYRFSYDSNRIDNAASWIVLGILFKFGISGGLEQLVFRDETASPLIILISAAALELRLYFDLAGYSFIAFGLSRLLGIELTLNFSHPFFSQNVQEFWRNWHISLGRWYHTYLYAPLRKHVGDRSAAHIALLMLVFVASAMWHGITINFLMWGLYHGGIFVLFVTVLAKFQWSRWSGLVALWAFLIFGRLLFMDSETPRLLDKLHTLFSWEAWIHDLGDLPTSLSAIGLTTAKLFYTAAAIAVIAFEGLSKRFYPNSQYQLFHTRVGSVCCLISALLLMHSSQPGFIYARQ